MSKVAAKHILLTGATRGIGRALVDRFVEHGHTVFGCGRSSAIIHALRDAYPPPHRFDTADVSEWGEVETWANELLAQTGPPDLLINNAGVMNRSAPLWEIGDDEFNRVLSVNLGGTANLIRAFVPAMIKRGSGVIVNLSSGWGRSTSPDVAPYCATKWGIEGLTQALSQELPGGLTAVAVNPGIIDTEMLRTVWGEGAGSFPAPGEWSQRAAPFLLGLGPEDNGRSLSIP
jgi:NAD(P)-dependent dehydrogenase (short-subunit alcohol dehydrogenase family)